MPPGNSRLYNHPGRNPHPFSWHTSFLKVGRRCL